MIDAEALFFIYDKQSQILECYILGQQSVSAYDQIHFSGLKLLHGLLLLLRGPES